MSSNINQYQAGQNAATVPPNLYNSTYPNNTFSYGQFPTNNPYQGYFTGYPQSSTDGYNPSNPLAFDTSMGGGAGMGQGTLPVTTLLGRFEALSGRLDTQVNGTADKKIDTNDLVQALNDKSGKYSDEDKKVIQQMLDNAGGVRGKLDGLDKSDDGIIEIGNINKMLVNPHVAEEADQKPEDKMSNTEALSVMSDYMGTAIHNGHSDKYVDKHGKLVASQRGAWSTDRAKLLKMSEDEQVPEDVRVAAKKLLSNKALFKKADTAHKNGKPDGRISIKDLQTANSSADIDDVGKTPENTYNTPGLDYGYTPDTGFSTGYIPGYGYAGYGANPYYNGGSGSGSSTSAGQGF